MYLGSKSNTISELFDTGFACHGTPYTYVDNVVDGHKIDHYVQDEVTGKNYISQFIGKEPKV